MMEKDDYIDTEILVEFEHNRTVWDKVVFECEENMYVETENTDTFKVAYANQDALDKAITRFNGMVKYTIL